MSVIEPRRAVQLWQRKWRINTFPNIHTWNGIVRSTKLPRNAAPVRDLAF
jgi:hypothetical protein